MHIMLDLETLGTNPGCAILSIGAVAFSPEAGSISSAAPFYAELSLESTLPRFSVEPNTLRWWLDQGVAARGVFAGQIILEVALEGFARWFAENYGHELWAHGAVFDEPILRAAYRACGLKEPWAFWNVRDTRTLFALTDTEVDRAKGTHHNALDDARAQAEAVIGAYKKLGSLLPESMET